jgi:mono/diheme cytochrome c family protein
MRRCRQIRLIKGASEVGKSSAMPACGVVLKEIQIKAVIVYIRTLADASQRAHRR